MIKLKELLNESSESTYSYGCVMLYFKFPQMEQIHSIIEPNDVYTESDNNTYGIEDEPHCTLLYGLHDTVTITDVTKIVNNYKFESCIVHNASLFENDYDVLKFDVDGDSLYDCNRGLKKLPFTSDYPDYHPHMTIAYLESGAGDAYVNTLKGKRWKLKPNYIIFSQANGSKTKIKINDK